MALCVPLTSGSSPGHPAVPAHGERHHHAEQYDAHPQRGEHRVLQGPDGGFATPWLVPNMVRAAATTADMGFQFANARSQAGMFAVFTNTLDTKPSRNDAPC